MFRNIQRVTRSTKLFITPTKASVFRPARSLTFSTLRALPKNNIPNTPRKLFLTRNYVTTPDSETSERSSEPPEDPKDIPWLEFLESAAKAPWLSSTPSNHEDILRRSYSLLFHIILYLGRPMSNNVQEAQDLTNNFLLAFDSAPVPVESEIGRARHAIAILTKQMTKDLSSVPQSSDLRTKHQTIFALTDALVPLCDVHLDGLDQNKPPLTGDIVDSGGKWQDFWQRAQPVVLAVGEELDKAGYGINEELMNEAKAEKERKEKEGK